MHFQDSRKQVCQYNLVTRETQHDACGNHVNRNWVGCAVGVVCICSILANVVLVVVHTEMQREVGTQREDIDKLSAIVSRHDVLLRSQLGQELSDPTHSPQQPRGDHTSKHRRSLRHAHHQVHRHAVTQLQGAGGDYEDIRRGSYLLWKRPARPTYRNSFAYDFAPGSTKLQSIKIKTPGIYYVFSQVAFHGRTEMTDISECGYEIVKESEDGSGLRLLLKSIVTQDGEGRYYYRQNVYGRMYPLDTKPVSGVFHLYQNDRLLVRISDYCRAFARISMDEHYTHFGAFLVTELRNG